MLTYIPILMIVFASLVVFYPQIKQFVNFLSSLRSIFPIGSTVYWAKCEFSSESKSRSDTAPCRGYTVKILKGKVISSDRKTSFVRSDDGDVCVNNSNLSLCEATLKKNMGLILTYGEERELKRINY